MPAVGRLDLTLILLRGEYVELLIMAADGI
jgi:hypothetical protein